MYKLKKFKMLVDPSEKTITINPDININILNLEKNAIYALMKENLTLERLEHILETGKYLRN